MIPKTNQPLLWTESPPAHSRRAAPGQERVYQFIAAFKIENDGNSPTYRQIANGCGISRNGAYLLCLKLVRWGRIAFTEDGRIILIGGEYAPPQP